jgi:hypothetical protein
MKLKKILISSLVLASVVASCKKFDTMLDNPNSPSVSSASADLYLNEAQLSFAGFFNGTSDVGMQLTRQIVFFGPTYVNGYSPQSFDGMWSTGYTGALKHINALIPIADQQKKYVNLGMAKIMKAYILMTMVDMFGDVPYTEANLGSTNLNPKADKGSAVYAAAIALLDEAITDLGKTPGSYPGTQDLFFGATNAAGAAKWRTLAKTLKLRAYVQTRLVDNTVKAKIDALLTENDLINATANDFEFKYSTKLANPNSRHPRYNGNYTASGSAGDYMGTWFLWTMVQEKGNFSNNTAADQSDPRTRYYFYRQRINYADVTQASSSCSVAPAPSHYPPGMPFCLTLAGFWGRDHGDNSGIPPDGNLRSTWGIYPAGGQFDENQSKSVALEVGGRGAGIQPIWQSAFTDFLKAESALTLATAGDPRALLESAVRKSIAKVTTFPATIGVTPTASFVPDATKINNYVNKVLALYDAASTTDAKLNVIMKEYYLALWGNGMDSWNNYRRTGKPSGMQLAIVAAPGKFMRSAFYPSVFVNRNINATQKAGVDLKVFWDTNPSDLQ